LPFFTHKTKHGEIILAVDPNDVQKYLDLNDEDVVRLTLRFLYPKPAHLRLKHIPLDRKAIAEQYTELIKAGVCQNQADVARHFGVSRAWVTKVMNTLKPT
jgi:hypothetical protein